MHPESYLCIVCFFAVYIQNIHKTGDNIILLHVPEYGNLVTAREYNIMSCGMRFPTMWHLTCVDSDEPLQPPVRLRNSKWYSVSRLTIIESSSDQQMPWSDCAYAQADLRLCWSHILHCWKSHALALNLLLSCHIQMVIYWHAKLQ